MPIGVYSRGDVETRFWKKVAIRDADDCWEWNAALYRKNSYGVFWYQGKNIGTHRMSWILTNGDIPENLYVCHKCDNKKCVNPNHLFVGTAKDNQTDMWNKGRGNRKQKYESYLRGDNNPSSKISDMEVSELREIYSRELMTSNMLATKYGISKATVKRILKNKSRVSADYTVPSNYGWGIHNPIMRGKYKCTSKLK